uniref:TRAP transporter small permease n=1 Tax=candidate division WOR-3 bacterium TaxID=2052148 RepID=A0A7C2K3Z6_UNCW3
MSERRREEVIISKIVQSGLIIGTCALIGVMFIIDANVIYRAFGGIIAGTYDLVEIIIVVAVAFAIPYTQFYQAHTRVDLFTSMMSPRGKFVFEFFSNFISVIYWAIIVWATIGITIEKAKLGERTSLLKISIIPFRILWIIGLIMVILIIIWDILFRRERAFSTEAEK